jgi:heme-degrading monooxygenase HmoA
VSGGEFVVESRLEIDPGAVDVLEAAFADRLGEVESAEGFVRLEVWRDEQEPGRYTMVSWWASADAFRAYLRSDAHRRSHARIPTSPSRPRGIAVRRHRVIAR